MAIKGKSKSRGTRAVTQGPKPAYVPVKPPFLRRREVWTAVAAALAVAAIAGLWYGFAQQASDDRARDRRERREAAEAERQEQTASVMSDYQGSVVPILATVGQALPPTGFLPFQELTIALDDVDRGRRVDGAIETALETRRAAEAASEDLADLDPLGDSQADLDQLFVVYVLDSREGMLRGLDLYAQAASLISMAAEAEGDRRADLVAAARDTMGTASLVFAGAYSDYVQAQSIAGVSALG